MSRTQLGSHRLGGLQDFLIADMRRRGPVRDKGQLEVVDNPVDHSPVGEAPFWGKINYTWIDLRWAGQETIPELAVAIDTLPRIGQYIISNKAR